MTRRRWATWAAAGAVVGVIAWIGSAFRRGHPSQLEHIPASASEAHVRALDIAFYERRLAEDSFSAADRARLAGLYLQRARETGSDQDFDRAEALATGSLALRSAHNADTYALLTAARLAKHDFAGALQSAQGLYEADTANAASRALLAEVELEVGNYERAGLLFASVVAEGDKPTIAARLARWYEITGRSVKARAVLQRAANRLTGVPDLPREQLAWFHYRLGELELRSGRLDHADSAFQRALQVFPGDYRALGALARLAVMREEWQSAIDNGARAIAIQVDPATLGTMSDAYAALGDTAQARSFADAMAASALSRPGSIHRAWGHFLLDDDRDVERVLTEARADLTRRRDVYAYDLLAWALYKAGHIAEARRASLEALSQGTEDPHLFYHAGMIAVAVGDSAGGRALLGKAIAINPRFAPEQAAIARRMFAMLGAAASVGDRPEIAGMPSATPQRDGSQGSRRRGPGV